jgi:DNA-binding transcriptional ArsR family regulator
VDAALKAIAEPRRRAILRLVWDRELAAGEIASHFDVTRPAVSQHLRVLKDADLVDERRDGTRRFYVARRETVGELRKFLDDYWSGTLSRLRDAAEDEEQQKRRGTKSPDERNQ